MLNNLQHGKNGYCKYLIMVFFRMTLFGFIVQGKLKWASSFVIKHLSVPCSVQLLFAWECFPSPEIVPSKLTDEVTIIQNISVVKAIFLIKIFSMQLRLQVFYSILQV